MRKNRGSKFILIICVITSSVKIQAQVTNQPDTVQRWKNKFNFGVNLNQASFSSNWKAGGINSIGLNSLANLTARYAEGRDSWDNEIDLLYGLVNNEGQGYRKTTDRIFLDTKYGYALTKNWSLFTSLNFLTQFAPGYEYGDDTRVLISDFLAPGFLTSAWGLEYHPVEYFKVRIAPIAPRLTFVKNPERFVTADNPEPYGVKPPDEVRYEWLAFQLYADFNKDIAENLNLQWRYVLFANYETLKFKTIDHRIDLNVTAKVNRFLNVLAGAILLYDYDQDDQTQLSQLLNIGVLYTFQNYTED